MDLTDQEKDELQQLLLYKIYPEAYADTPNDMNILLDILQKLEELVGDEVTPRCDICGFPQECGKEDCWICPSDWNGKTGNHFSCEKENPNSAEYYAQLTNG